MADKNKLNPRQIAFCIAYAKHGNATKAYLDAGYKVSEKVAGTNGPRLLENAGISEHIRKLQKPALKRAEVSIDRITQELAKVAFADIGDVIELDSSGNARLRADADLSSLDAVSFNESSGKAGNSRGFSVKKSDKLKALDMLLKMTGGYDREPDADSGNLRANAGRILESLRNLRKKQ
jgi:phage terminase small subunit